MTRRAVGGAQPTGAYSPGVVVDGWLFVSGQGPLRGDVVQPGSIEEQTRLTLENVLAVVQAAGGEVDDIVRCGVFLSNLDDFDGMNHVFEEFFAAPRPARTTVGAALLGIKVEIDAVARLTTQQSP